MLLWQALYQVSYPFNPVFLTTECFSQHNLALKKFLSSLTVGAKPETQESLHVQVFEGEETKE